MNMCAPADVAERSPRDLCGAALSLWRFAGRRRPGQAKIRVYNPELAADGWSSPHTIVEIVNDDMPFLVDSVTGAINAGGRVVRLVIHPILTVDARSGRTAARARATGDGGSARIVDADRDHPRTRSGEPGAPDRRPWPVSSPMSAPRSTIGSRCAQTLRALLDELPGPPAPPAPAAELAEVAGFSALARRRQFHLSRLSRIRFRRGGRTGTAGARDPARSGLSGLRRAARSVVAAARRAGFRAPPRAARHHQIEPPRDRSPHRAYGRDRAAPLRRGRRSRWRPAVPRAVHLARLQPQPARDPAAAAQGSPHRRARRAVADQP